MCLLHGVGDDHHGHLVRELGDRLRDPPGRGGVQRAGFVQQQHPRAYRPRPRDAQSLLRHRDSALDLRRGVSHLVPQLALVRHSLMRSSGFWREARIPVSAAGQEWIVLPTQS